jgi:hypothetical protein
VSYADPEKARESKRRWYEANRERILEQRRSDPDRWEKHKAASRRYYHANREKEAERSRAWREANPERVRENMQRWLAAGGVTDRRRRDVVTRLWNEQVGKCYLCERAMPVNEAVLEHDHRCHPRLAFCDSCVRGVACSRCNHVIGHANDDPDRLELIARNLRAKLAEMNERLPGARSSPQ